MEVRLMAEKRKNPHRYREAKPLANKGWTKFFFYLDQLTWGLTVNLVGAVVFLICKIAGCRSERFCHAVIVYSNKKNFGGLSLGLFIFMNAKEDQPWKDDTQIHEYGHTIQCLLLGPLYWLVVALPSAIWCNFFASYRKKHHISYYKLYCESWANKWGEKWSGKKQSFHLPTVKATRKI